MNFFKSKTDPPPTTEAKKEELPNGKGTLENMKEMVQSVVIDKIQTKTESVVATAQNIQIGLIVMLIGFVFVGLSFMFIPMIVIAPYKFCALNSLGTVHLIIALFLFRGRALISVLFSRRKILFTLTYLVTLGLEVYFSVFNKQYVAILITMAAHLISILYLLFSSLPFGVGMLNTMFKKMGSGILSQVSGESSSLPM